MNHRAIVGTYTTGDSEGLYSCAVTVDEAVTMRVMDTQQFIDNPSFFALHPVKPHLYVVHEVPGGGISAYRIEDGSLHELNWQPSGAGGPCQCSVHPSGEFLFVAHYTDAAVSMVPIADNGSLRPPADVVDHEGSGPDPERQTQAHPHSVTVGPDGRYLYVADLGTDTIEIYDPDYDAGKLEHVDCVETDPGAGPRHVDVHPNDPIFYLITEMGSSVVTYEWDPDTGGLQERATVSTLPADFDGHNQTSEIRVHPSGEWVYGANRGHDSIAAFAVRDDSTLDPVGHFDTVGEWPRYFCFGPSGETLFVQNRESSSIDGFRLDSSSGALEYADSSLDVPNPACMTFVE